VIPLEEKTVSFSTPKTDSHHSISCAYSTRPLEQILQQKGLLVAINFGEARLPTTNPKLYNCGLTVVENPDVTEIWTTTSAIEYGTQDQCHWSQTDELLFASLVVDESGFANQQTAVKESYLRLLSLIGRRDYPHIVRAWNYMADINLGNGETERYKQFCVGRQQAFLEYRYNPEQYPSACALGHDQQQTVIYLLAAKEPGRHFENPNQQSAYQYPRQYGPKSPSFARATMAGWAAGQQLFISGTASIIGHVSVVGDDAQHPNDFSAQMNTTLANIDQLLGHVAKQACLAVTPAVSILKVYLRRACDLHAAKAAINKHFGDAVPTVYLQADICRQELLVEIDGLCEL